MKVAKISPTNIGFVGDYVSDWANLSVLPEIWYYLVHWYQSGYDKKYRRWFSG